jgi:hypothetical protein
MTLPPLPEPAHHVRVGDCRYVGAWSKKQVHTYGKACAAAERDRIRLALCAMHADAAGRHNYYLCAAVELFGPPASLG